MKFISKKVLSKLYNHTSLRRTGGGIRFSVKNRLSPSMLHGFTRVAIDGQNIQNDLVTIAYEKETPWPSAQINPENPVEFPLGAMLTFYIGSNADFLH